MTAKNDLEKALAASDQIAKPFKVVERRKTPGGSKRMLARNNTRWREPLDGLDIKHSDWMRTIVAGRMAGKTIDEAAEMAGISTTSANNLIRRNHHAYDLAVQEVGTRYAEEYQINLFVLKTALSEVGIKALNTLVDVMDNPESAAGVRVKAAQAVLKMVNLDGSAGAGAKVNVEGDFIKILKLPQESDGFADTYVIEAEEVTDGGEVLGDPV
jgi:hypothetical protein